MTEYYIANNGQDISGNGTLLNPFLTLKYANTQCSDGDTLIFRGGNYELEETTITKEVTIKSYELDEEDVILDGTRDINDVKKSGYNWQSLQKTIIIDNSYNAENVTLYKIKIADNTDIWQVFSNRDEVINARFPSAQWSDNFQESTLEEHWGHGYYNKPAETSEMYYDNGQIIDNSTNLINLREYVDNVRSNVNSNFDLSGALINLNVGSFRTWTKVVNNMDLSTSNLIKLSYDQVPSGEWKTKHHYYYLENKLEFLNSENECFLDRTENELYIRLNNDIHPNLGSIRVKTQTYSIIIDSHDVSIENINFFGTTFKINSTKDNINVSGCNFLYPSCYAHMLNQINHSIDIDPTIAEVFTSMTYSEGGNSDCSLNNCVFKYTDGMALQFNGPSNNIINCYFSHIDKTVANLSSVMTAIRLNGTGGTITNNTFYKTSASSTINPGNQSTITYNNLSNSGYLQSDGAMIHCMVNQQPRVNISYNWCHDTIKYGIRFDGDGDGNNGYIHHNVCWNCEGGIMVKGGIIDNVTNESVGGHYVYNNTVFDTQEKNGIMVLNIQKGNLINYGSVCINNWADRISGHRSNAEDLCGNRIVDLSNNTMVDVLDNIVSFSLRDFRPRSSVDSNQFIIDKAITDLSGSYETYINNPNYNDESGNNFNPTLFGTNNGTTLTEDIGAMINDEPSWRGGITWYVNNSDSETDSWVSNNRLAFYNTIPICFLKGTPVVTDQGEIEIEKITNKNTINGQKVFSIIKSKNLTEKIILISKNAICHNVPSKDTYISMEHGIYINNKMVIAKNLINGGSIRLKYIGVHYIYNVLLKNHSKMLVNNMVVETMNPKNVIIK